ncbi:LysR family transcriptional regulator [Devosia riboflavina]|uniref:LysR family transcriptional regulator n=1 Tax=Devosia riboflavina TaxID=46914 RepID=A0A087LY74_9HYPH|nr:LysR substrate-binding domain-containing protein [Devosia riboflavina]KFL29577.1 LysR family transcriptional regulator [Devosia riboflavina]
MSGEIEGIVVFLAIAEARNFRLAGERLGVTRSAVSQALQRLEDRVGTSLVLRTTRSVRLTEAGQLLYERANASIHQLQEAIEAVRDHQARPGGLLRIAVSSIAESFLSGAFLSGFIQAYPEVNLDILVTDEEFDIVEAGFDAGVRLGEIIEQDMIAVPVSARQRQCAAAAPAYLQRHGRPGHPFDLKNHVCIGWRPRPDTAPYRWEFAEDGRQFDMSVDPAVTTNDMRVMLRLACVGAGITFGVTETFRSYFDRGELVPLLEDFCPPFQGFYLYYPQNHRQPLKLKVLVDYIRRYRPS